MICNIAKLEDPSIHHSSRFRLWGQQFKLESMYARTPNLPPSPPSALPRNTEVLQSQLRDIDSQAMSSGLPWDVFSVGFSQNIPPRRQEAS